MRSYELKIEGRLPGLNEYIRECRSNKMTAAREKRDSQDIVGLYIMQQLKGVRIKSPVRIDYRWYEPNRRRDLDNISSYGRKVIQDALVESGVLCDDGWRQVTGFSDSFYIDKEHPRIEVTITEVSPLSFHDGGHEKGMYAEDQAEE